MFLRSKVQEMILRRRSRSMNSSAAAVSCDGGGKGAPTRAAPFASPKLLQHSSSLPAGSCGAVGSPLRDPDTPPPPLYSMSPTSVLDASAAFAAPGSPVGGGSTSKRRPWCDGCGGLADALDCDGGQQRQRRSVLAAVKAPAPALVRSCSLDRRVEFGVKNKSSWLPIHGGRAPGEETKAAAVSPAPEEMELEMEPSSEDYTCVISRGPNPRTVHIFGDRVIEGAGESSPRQIINLPPPPAAGGDRGFLSL